MAEKKQRKCSVCRRPGHTKRTCKRASLNSTPHVKKRKKRTTKPSVVVHVCHDKKQSPHIVDLRPEKKVAPERVKAFREAYEKVAPIREGIDLASMVRKANQKTKIERLEQEVVQLRNMVRKQQTQGVVSQPILQRDDRIVVKKARRRITFHRTVASSVKQKWNGAFNAVDNRAQQFVQGFTVRRFIASFVILVLIGSLPFPAFGYYKKVRQDSAELVEQSTNAFLSLQSSTLAALQANIAQAQFDLNSALGSFNEAQSFVDQEHQILGFVASMLPVIGKQVRSRQHVLSAGHHLALGNTYLVKGVSAASEDDDLNMTDRFNIIQDHLQASVPQYRLALEDLQHVESSSLPTEYQDAFEEFKLLFAAFISDMGDLADLVDVINKVFGADGLKRYLVMFQNNHELRATGGFLGSFAVVDVQKGKIMNIEVPGGGTYDIKGQLNVFVEPPEPLQVVNGRWEFQDSNWFPDFAASAEKMAWFYQHGRGATVDGVIAINASVLERFLRVVGPMENEEFDLLVDADNVLQTVQEEVELNYDKEENKPKAVVASMLEQLLEGMKEIDAVSAIRLLSEIHTAAQQKEIQASFIDNELQKEIRSFGWTGEIVETAPTQDYLMVVNTNIGGQKSDAKIEQDITHQAQVMDDGSIINTVNIKRTHTGVAGEQFYGGPNIDYIRVYVPKGSELLDANGFTYPPEDVFKVPEEWYRQDPHLADFEKEKGIHAQSGTRVSEQFGKTTFGNWMSVLPGETSEVTFVYKLPMQVKMEQEEAELTTQEKWRDIFFGDAQRHGSRYSLFIQKQSGINSAFHSQIVYPDGWQPVWRSRGDIQLAVNGALFTTTLHEDQVLGVVMEKN